MMARIQSHHGRRALLLSFRILILRQVAALAERDEQLRAQRLKNGELRDKNYKAMDALAQTEKALMELRRTSAASASARLHDFVQRLFPDLQLPSKTSADADDQQLADAVSQHVKRSVHTPTRRTHSRILNHLWYVVPGRAARTRWRTTRWCWRRRRSC